MRRIKTEFFREKKILGEKISGKNFTQQKFSDVIFILLEMAALQLLTIERRLRLAEGFDTLPKEVREMIEKHETINLFGGDVKEALNFIYELIVFCTIRVKDVTRKKENYCHLCK